MGDRWVEMAERTGKGKRRTLGQHNKIDHEGVEVEFEEPAECAEDEPERASSSRAGKDWLVYTSEQQSPERKHRRVLVLIRSVKLSHFTG